MGGASSCLARDGSQRSVHQLRCSLATLCLLDCTCYGSRYVLHRLCFGYPSCCILRTAFERIIRSFANCFFTYPKSLSSPLSQSPAAELVWCRRVHLDIGCGTYPVRVQSRRYPYSCSATSLPCTGMDTVYINTNVFSALRSTYITRAPSVALALGRGRRLDMMQ